MLSYDLKNGVERLGSRNADRMGFPGLWWAVPRFVVVLEHGEATLHTAPADQAAGLAWSDELLRPSQGSSSPIGPGGRSRKRRCTWSGSHGSWVTSGAATCMS